MNILSPAISSFARMRLWRIEAWKNNPLDAQREVLQDIVTAAQYTEFGKKYNFSQLFNVKAFKEAVPVHEYQDIKPYVERIMNGEQKYFMEHSNLLVCKKQRHHQRKKQIHSH